MAIAPCFFCPLFVSVLESCCLAENIVQLLYPGFDCTKDAHRGAPGGPPTWGTGRRNSLKIGYALEVVADSGDYYFHENPPFSRPVISCPSVGEARDLHIFQNKSEMIGPVSRTRCTGVTPKYASALVLSH